MPTDKRLSKIPMPEAELLAESFQAESRELRKVTKRVGSGLHVGSMLRTGVRG